MTGRAKRALEVLRAGGFFRRALERGWHGEKFAVRLYSSAGRRVEGVGHAAHRELADAGMLTTRPCPRSSTWPTEWVLWEFTDLGAGI